jgi:ATPase subunit of ABC transporter with duplicated ATPase domains
LPLSAVILVNFSQKKMSFNRQTLIQFNNLKLELAGKLLLEDISGSVLSGDKIGLVGINGSGKSTLLKCLAAEIPCQGDISRSGEIVYVPQLQLEAYRSSQPLFEFVAARHESWWEVLLKLEEVFASELRETAPLQSLSGGELVKLNICIALAKAAAVILLDEPTNHLDKQSLEQLARYLKQTNTAFVIVSHNVDFLNETTSTTWQLSSGRLKTYGGNYRFYKRQRQQEIQAQQQLLESRRKEKQKLIQAAERDKQRSQRNLSKGSKSHNPGEDKFFKGFFGNRSQKKAGGNKLAYDSKIQAVEEEIAELKTSNRKLAKLNITAHSSNSGLLFSIESGSLILPTGRKLLKDIALSIYGGDRLAILGNNGSGKSTLVRQFSYKRAPLLKGGIKYGDQYRTMYLDQKLSTINRQLSLVGNLRNFNSSLTFGTIRKALANLGFPKNYNVNRKAESLSGGELTRLSFAIATTAEVDLLILDEPTNNLDIETVEVIAENLKQFEGTLIAISHDGRFLRRIGIDKYLTINGGQIRPEDSTQC